MNTPPKLMDEQIRQSADRCDEGQEDTEFMLAFARAIETARDQMWSKMLSSPEPFGYVSEHNCEGPYKFQFHQSPTTVYWDNCKTVTKVYAAPHSLQQLGWEREIAAVVLDHCYGHSGVSDDMIDRAVEVIKTKLHDLNGRTK